MELCLSLCETDERIRKGRSNESIKCMHERNYSQDEHMGLWKICGFTFGQKVKGIFKQELIKLFHCKLKGLIIKLNFV